MPKKPKTMVIRAKDMLNWLKDSPPLDMSKLEGLTDPEDIEGEIFRQVMDSTEKRKVVYPLKKGKKAR